MCCSAPNCFVPFWAQYHMSPGWSLALIHSSCVSAAIGALCAYQNTAHFKAAQVIVELKNGASAVDLVLTTSSRELPAVRECTHRLLIAIREEAICVARTRAECSAAAIVPASMVAPPCSLPLMGARSASSAAAANMSTANILPSPA